MSGSVVVTSRRTTVVFLPSAEIFQEETAFSVSRASRALSKAVGNPATGNLPVCRNSFGVRIETFKKSALLGNQSREIPRERERERESARERASVLSFEIRIHEK